MRWIPSAFGCVAASLITSLCFATVQPASEETQPNRLPNQASADRKDTNPSERILFLGGIQDPKQTPAKKQPPTPPQDKRKEVKEQLAELKRLAGKGGKEDSKAVEALGALKVEFMKSGPKDRKAIAKGVAACLKQKRKQAKDGSFNNALYEQVVETLVAMGPEGGPELMPWIDHKLHKSNLDLRAKVIEAVGQVRYEKGIKPLLKLLGHNKNELEGAASRALSHFGHLPEKKRKEIFQAVLKELMVAKNDMDGDIENNYPYIRRRWNVVSASMMGALSTLSGHKETTALGWRKWWNKNKKAKWAVGKAVGTETKK